MESDDFLNYVSGIRSNMNSIKPKWLVVGNESSDLDSVICSLVYGFYKQSILLDEYVVLPICCIKKANMQLRNDVLVWLKMFQIDAEQQLLFMEEISPLFQSASFCQDLKISVVDHHKPVLDNIQSFIVEVLDHRESTFTYPTNQLQIDCIKSVGSCCTLVASYILNNEGIASKNTLMKMLYGVILLDTDCLSELTGKTTTSDVECVAIIEKLLKFSLESRLHIYNTLTDAKSFISNLSFDQMLQRDLKVLNLIWKKSPIRMAMPTLINIDVEDLLSVDNVEGQLSEMLTKLDVSIIIALTCGTSLIRRRGYLIYSNDIELNSKLATHIASVQFNLNLEFITENLESKLVACSQNSLLTSRKLFIPIVEYFFRAEDKGYIENQSNNCFIQIELETVDDGKVVVDLLEIEGAPYTLSTPRRSVSESPDMQVSDGTLPSLNNKEMVERVDRKRQKHRADVQHEDEIPEPSDEKRDFGNNGVSPNTFTPNNSDEESDDVPKHDTLGPLPSLNNITMVCDITTRRSRMNKESDSQTDISQHHSTESQDSFTPFNSVCEDITNKCSPTMEINNWENEIYSLPEKVDIKRKKLEIDHGEDSVMKDVINGNQGTIESVMSYWGNTLSKSEKVDLLNNFISEDVPKIADLLADNLIRECLSSDAVPLVSEDKENKQNIERNNDVSCNKDDTFKYTEEAVTDTDEEFPNQELVPYLEIIYETCPIGTIVSNNSNPALLSQCVNSSSVDIVENTSFNLYRRISSNQVNFSSEEKQLLTAAGNLMMDNDVIYSDSEHDSNHDPDSQGSDSNIDRRKIVHPDLEICLETSNLELNTNTEITVDEVENMPTADLKSTKDRNLMEIGISSINRCHSGPSMQTDEAPTTVHGGLGDDLFYKYKAVMSDEGDYLDATNGSQKTKIIVLYSHYLPSKNDENYHEIMQYIFNHITGYLDSIDADYYTLVYFHCYGSRMNTPPFYWIRDSYKAINYKLKKNLKHLYIVQPTIWVRALVLLSQLFINSKFFRKIRYVSVVDELDDLISSSKINIPSDVLQS